MQLKKKQQPKTLTARQTQQYYDPVVHMNFEVHFKTFKSSKCKISSLSSRAVRLVHGGQSSTIKPKRWQHSDKLKLQRWQAQLQRSAPTPGIKPPGNRKSLGRQSLRTTKLEHNSTWVLAWRRQTNSQFQSRELIWRYSGRRLISEGRANGSRQNCLCTQLIRCRTSQRGEACDVGSRCFRHNPFNRRWFEQSVHNNNSDSDCLKQQLFNVP